MDISAIQRPMVASDVAPEQLAGNTHLTQQQKIAEASRQFEAVLLRQILGESQKPVIQSEFTDNSTAAGIYHDMITTTLADSMSKSGTFGLAKIFDQQLSPPPANSKAGHPAGAPTASTAGNAATAGATGTAGATRPDLRSAVHSESASHFHSTLSALLQAP